VTSRHRAMKIRIMNVYGNGTCACCGEAEIAFLSIDHIDGRGAAHRRELLGLPADYRAPASGASLYNALEKAGYPGKDKLQVLCLNCNRAKHDLGRCPHDSERVG
jgi:hypothetical protein